MKTALVAALVLALGLLSAVFFTRPRSGKAEEPRAVAEDLRGDIERLREDLANLRTELQAHETLHAPAPPLPETPARRAPETPSCDRHCEALRGQIDSLTRRIFALEGSRIPFAASAPPMPGGGEGKRSWAPEQATGPPDTSVVGDHPTAWASLTPDGQDEWLLLDYPDRVRPVGLQVHETFNPGALSRVTVFQPNGREVDVWTGFDPTPAGTGQGVSFIPIQVNFRTNRVKLYLDSPRVAGWNEIDAVGLLDDSGRTHWATAAAASTTYADVSARVAPGEYRVRSVTFERPDRR